LRAFERYEKAYALVDKKRRLVVVDKQSTIWTKVVLCGIDRNHGQGVHYVRVKSNSLLPLPTTNEWSW
jgi:hypothetical protein